jgi:uncharacterized protein
MEGASMKQTTWIVFGWLVLMLSITAHAASFDCAKAGTKIEKLICADAELSKLDEELNAAYKAVVQDKTKADVVKRVQRQWMKERNGCADAACVKGAYEARLQSLASVSEKAIVKQKMKARFTVTEGKGWSVCESYAKFLNTLSETLPEEAYPVCHLKLSSDFPDLKEPDWEKVDIPSNLELVYGIEKILSPSAHDRPVDSFDHWKAVYEQQIRNGEASPRLRRTHLALLDNAPMETILAYEPDACKRYIEKYGSTDSLHTNLFLWDEKEQKIQPYISTMAFGGVPKELLLFQGKPLTFFVGLDYPSDMVSGEVYVSHFKKVDFEPYASLPRCRISFEMPRELYERIIK